MATSETPPAYDSSAADRAARPWGPWVLAALMLGLAALVWIHGIGRLPIDSGDTGWHLSTGRWISEQGKVPTSDPFCFTSDGLSWTNLNWFAQWIFYGCYRVGGLVGLQALGLVLASVALCFAWLDLRARRVPPHLGGIGLLLIAAGLAFVPEIRPRLFTFALVSGFAWILARPDPEDRLGRGPALALLGGQLLWNHLHGGFVYGYCILGADALGTAIASGRRGGSWAPERSRWLAGVVILGLASFGLHPHGYEAPWHALNYVQRLGPDVIPYVNELRPLDPHSAPGRYFELTLLLAVFGAVFGQRPRLREVLIAVPLLHLALQMSRGLIPLLLVALPWVVASYAPVWRQHVLSRRMDRLSAPAWRAVGWVLIASVSVWSAAQVLRAAPGRPNDVTSPGWHEHRLPVAAVAAIQSHGGSGRVLSSYWQGGLLDWALYPQRRVFVDGRGSVHGRGYAFPESRALLAAEPGWEEILARREVSLVLVGREGSGRQLGLHLSQDPAWRELHADSRWLVFERRPDSTSR